MKRLITLFTLFTSFIVNAQCDMEIISFDPQTMDITISVNSGINCGSPTDSIGEFLLGITTEPQLEEYPYPCFYENGWALLIYPVSFPLVNINSPGPWLQTGDEITFNIVDAFVTGSDASFCWEEAINDGFFDEQCWILSITQINDSYSWPYESNSGLGNFDYPDVEPLNNIVTFSLTNPDCNSSNDGPVVPCVNDDLYIPNAFTPNGDGKNETFRVVTEADCWLTWDMKIYDRWGNLVWRTDYPLAIWTGAPLPELSWFLPYSGDYYCPDGVYSWKLEATRPGYGIKTHGHVTLFR